MSQRVCVAMNCGARDHLFTWPKAIPTAKAWTKFVKMHRKDFEKPNSKSVLCFRHFEDQSFKNLMAYRLGATERLLIMPTAIPSIHLTPDSKVESPRQQRKELTPRERRVTLRPLLSPNVVPAKAREITLNLRTSHASTSTRSTPPPTPMLPDVVSEENEVVVDDDPEQDTVPRNDNEQITEWTPDSSDEDEFAVEQQENIQQYSMM